MPKDGFRSSPDALHHWAYSQEHAKTAYVIDIPDTQIHTSQYNIRPHVYHDYNHDDDDDNGDDDDSPPVLPAST